MLFRHYHQHSQRDLHTVCDVALRSYDFKTIIYYSITIVSCFN